jgi:hypothetical protein
MTPPEDKPKRPKVKPPADDTYAVSQPVEPTKRPRAVPAAPSILERAQLPLEREAERARPAPTRLPFLVGVFNFPWYLRTMAAWGMISIGLTVSLLGVLFCMYLDEQGVGVLAVRCFGVPVLLIATLTLSYASACCMAAIETTAEGYDEVIDWPSGYWRDWFFTMVAALAILAIAMGIGGLIGWWLGIGTWLPAAVTGYVFFPLFVLSTLEAGSMTVLVSWPVLRSFWSVWWGWLLFYVETGVAVAVAAVTAVAAFRLQPWLTPFIAGPAIGAAMLIYARLIGRLAWCFAEYGDKETGD